MVVFSVVRKRLNAALAECEMEGSSLFRDIIFEKNDITFGRSPTPNE